MASKKIIQKITVGPNPKDGLTYTMGRAAYTGDYKISLIEERETEKGVSYDVYIKGSVGEVLWKTFSGVPISIHYDIEGY